MFQILRNIFSPTPLLIVEPTPRITLSMQCLRELQTFLAPELQKQHEGVAYLFGLSTNGTTLATAAFRPDAVTSPGSFRVSAAAMADTVRAAARLHLGVVAQVHTHPKKAYHSDGDITGALIRYPGFTSIVLPDYGAHLPSFDRADILVFAQSQIWRPVSASDVVVIAEKTS